MGEPIVICLYRPLAGIPKFVQNLFFRPLAVLKLHLCFRDSFELYDSEDIQYFLVIYSPIFGSNRMYCIYCSALNLSVLKTKVLKRTKIELY